MGFQTFLAFLLCIVSILAGVIPVKYPQYAGIADFIFWAAIGLLLILIAVMVWSNRKHLMAGVKRLTGIQWLLLSGIGGTWLFLTVTLGTIAWLILNNSASGIGLNAQKDDGPLTWFYNLTLEGGPPVRNNVYALRFHGTNSSQKEVRLKEAVIRSALKGNEIALEVMAENTILTIAEINLIPPGAPIELVAKFNLPTGLTSEEFLATWSRFNLVVIDDTKEYRVPFNEGSLAAFFPGMVGPHITKKLP
jgi:hypothetical protein